MQVLRVRQAPRPARGRQLSESRSLLPSSSLFSGDALDNGLFHFSAFSDSSDEDRFCRLHLARRFLNQTCVTREDEAAVTIAGALPQSPGAPRLGVAAGPPPRGLETRGAARATANKKRGDSLPLPRFHSTSWGLKRPPAASGPPLGSF